jgi:hypothetical protein
MRTIVWLLPWDLDGIDPRDMTARLHELGATGCSVAFSYHAARTLLPSHPKRLVHEESRSALHFASNPAHYRGLVLQPFVNPNPRPLERFIEACVDEGLEIDAWMVLCHNDSLGSLRPDCVVENVLGERYTYALCPSNEHVRRYILALCADVVAHGGVSRLDLEALSFVG